MERGRSFQYRGCKAGGGRKGGSRKRRSIVGGERTRLDGVVHIRSLQVGVDKKLLSCRKLLWVPNTSCAAGSYTTGSGWRAEARADACGESIGTNSGGGSVRERKAIKIGYIGIAD